MWPAGSSMAQKHQAHTRPPEERATLNHASVDELVKVPSMMRSRANRIVRFRPYRMKNDCLIETQ